MVFHWFDLFLSLLTYAIIIGGSLFYFRNSSNGKKGSDGDGGVTQPIDPELDLPPGVCLPKDPVTSPRQCTSPEIFS